MSKSPPTYTSMLPWENRWEKPHVTTLLGQLEGSKVDTFGAFMNALRAYEQLQEDMIWAGEGWNWTVEFLLKGYKGHVTGPDSPDAFAYVCCAAEQSPAAWVRAWRGEVEAELRRTVQRWLGRLGPGERPVAAYRERIATLAE